MVQIKMSYSEIVRLITENKAVIVGLDGGEFEATITIETTDVHKHRFYCHVAGAQLLRIRQLCKEHALPSHASPARTYKITPSVLAEWQMAETGSYEDHGRPDASHVYCILTRSKSRLKIESEIKAAWLVHSAFYQGDISGLDPELVRTRAAIGRIGRQIAADYEIEFTGGLWYDESKAPDTALRERQYYETVAQVDVMLKGGRQ